MASDINSNSHQLSITIDVEDGINIAMKDHFKISMPPTERVISNVDILLGLFEKHNTKATFFILGEVAEAYPDLIKKIASNGHEIGVHGYHHEQLYILKPAKVSTEIRKAKCLIEDISGSSVYGFRAPAFSINMRNPWVLNLLANLGFKYDSSIVPVRMGRYGWKGFEKQIVRIEFSNDEFLIEAPLPVIKILGYTTLTGGGGYLRYFPLFFTNWAISNISKWQSVIIYMHPYELDTVKYPDFFYDSLKKERFRKSLPLLFYRFQKKSVYGKLDYLLGKYDFSPLIEVIDTLDSNEKISTISYNSLFNQCQ